MSVYKIAGSGTGGTENAVAQLDIQFDGVITAIFGSLRATLNADAEQVQWEVSFISTNTIGANDTRGSLFMMKGENSMTTSGQADHGQNAGIGGLSIVVNAGERLWLHASSSASTPSVIDVYVYVEDGQAVPTAQRRR